MAKMKKKIASKTKAGKPAGKECASLADVLGIDASTWGATEAATGGGGFPAGKGQTCVIEDVEVTESQKKNPIVKWTLVGTDAGNDGLKDFKNDGLRTEQNRSFLRRDMVAIGLDWPDTPAELGDALQDAIGREIVVDVVDKDEYHNIYFRDVTGDVPESGEAEAEAEEEAAGDEWTRKDLIGAGKAADNADEEAIDALTELAGEFDTDPDDYGTWTELADALMEEMEL